MAAVRGIETSLSLVRSSDTSTRSPWHTSLESWGKHIGTQVIAPPRESRGPWKPRDDP